MSKVTDKISGLKTYIVCAGAIIASAISWYTGDLCASQAITAIVASVVAMTTRSGIAKSGK